MENTCQVSRWAIHKSKLENLPPQAFAEAIQQVPNAVLLDCRTPSEFAFGHLPNAINFDYLSPDFVEKMEQFDPTATYLVYCRSERRSIRTCTLLKNGGFENIYNLDGGLLAWTEVFGSAEFVR